MRLPIIAIAVLLAGCEATLPTIVKVPVPVPCLTESPKSPVFITDSDLLTLNDYDFVVTLARDRKERIGYEAILEATISGCM